MKHCTKTLLMGLALTALPLAANAGTTNGSIPVTATVSAGCVVSDFAATPLTGSYSGGTSTSSFDVSMKCDNGLSWTVTIDSGLNANGTVRRAANSGNYLPYRLYTDAGLSNELTLASNTISGTGNAAVQTTTVYSKIQETDVPTATPALGAGSPYTDTLGASISW